MQRFIILVSLSLILVSCGSETNKEEGKQSAQSSSPAAPINEERNCEKNPSPKSGDNKDADNKDVSSDLAKSKEDNSITTALSVGGLMSTDADSSGAPKPGEFIKKEKEEIKEVIFDHDYLKSINSLTVGVSPDYPPFESLSQNKLQGFDIDMISEVAARLNKKVEFSQLPFYSLTPALGAKKIDLIASSMSSTKQRNEVLDFSLPYYKVKLALVFTSDTPEAKQQIFKGARIGVQTGSVMDSWLRSLYNERITRVVRDSNVQLLEELKLGNIDLVMVEAAQAKAIASNVLNDMNYSIAEGDFQNYSIAASKGSPLISFVNKVILEMTEDGTLAKLEKKWGLI